MKELEETNQYQILDHQYRKEKTHEMGHKNILGCHYICYLLAKPLDSLVSLDLCSYEPSWSYNNFCSPLFFKKETGENKKEMG